MTNSLVNLERRNHIKIMAKSLMLTCGTGFLVACSKEEKTQFKSIDLTGAEYAKKFSVPDQNGKIRTIEDFAGKVVVVFFGFLQCPDVCPTSLADLAQIKKSLGTNGEGEKFQAIFITVDPERDTSELLKAYMSNFDPSFLALRPSTDKLPELAREFKIYYKKVEGKTPSSYSVDHSAGSYLFDPKGRLRLYSRYGADREELTSDIRLLLKGA